MDTTVPKIGPRVHMVRLFVIALGIGIGIGIVASIAVLFAIRPKAWNSTAVAATPIRAYMSGDMEFVVQYHLRNLTDRDYRVNLRSNGGQHCVFENDFRGLTPASLPGTRIEEPVDPVELFLPPGQEVGLTIRTLVLASPETSRERLVSKLSDVSFRGFVIYDHANRLRIDLPFKETVIRAK